MEEIGLFEAIYTQRAIRRLKPDPVPEPLIRRLIDAAVRAPSGGNRQPWAFVVIREPETKRQIGAWYLDAWNRTYGAIPQEERDAMTEAMRRTYRSAEHLAHHLAEAPVLILVCAREAPSPGGADAAGHYGSIFPAVQNLLLAARGLGLGATLTTLHKLHEEEVKQLLGIPNEVETIALIPVGYPIGKYGPNARRPVERVTHWERWGNRRLEE
jgi:nitroreductase